MLKGPPEQKTTVPHLHVQFALSLSKFAFGTPCSCADITHCADTRPYADTTPCADTTHVTSRSVDAQHIVRQSPLHSHPCTLHRNAMASPLQVDPFSACLPRAALHCVFRHRTVCAKHREVGPCIYVAVRSYIRRGWKKNCKIEMSDGRSVRDMTVSRKLWKKTATRYADCRGCNFFSLIVPGRPHLPGISTRLPKLGSTPSFLPYRGLAASMRAALPVGVACVGRRRCSVVWSELKCGCFAMCDRQRICRVFDMSGRPIYSFWCPSAEKVWRIWPSCRFRG
jgi:hypothetical protein